MSFTLSLKYTCMCFLILLSGCARNISLKSSMHEENPVLNVSSSNIDSIYSVSIWNIDTLDHIWYMRSPSEVHKLKIEYGQIPDGMIQVYPRDGKRPRQLRRGEKICISLTYAYDSIVPNAGTKEYVYKVLDNGDLEALEQHISKHPGVISEFP